MVYYIRYAMMENRKYGIAAAAALVLFLFIFVFTMMQLLLKENQGGKQMNSRKISRFFVYFLLLTVGADYAAPLFFWMFSSAFKTTQEINRFRLSGCPAI